eukprot:1375835-Amorphochlora_amoeboformis.AAC.1
MLSKYIQRSPPRPSETRSGTWAATSEEADFLKNVDAEKPTFSSGFHYFGLMNPKQGGLTRSFSWRPRRFKPQIFTVYFLSREPKLVEKRTIFWVCKELT